jgi:glucosamine--fructose-6-phosphate aminotransferase (isomerizing)
MGLREEILEQPTAARRQLASPAAGLDELARRLRADPVDSVVIAARGTSDHAAIYAQYLLGVRNGLSVGLATPSILSLYDAEPRVGRSLVIGISQSGASPDVVGVIESARRQGAPTLAITNAPDSPLGSAADAVIDLAAGPELAIAATKTYTTSLLALVRLSRSMPAAGSLLGQPAAATAAATAADVAAADVAAPAAAADGAALAGIPAALEAALEVEPAVMALAHELASGPGAMDGCVIVGRGFEYATAREWALKLKELGRVFADPYSAADFRHGPIALVQPGVPVFVLAPEGAAAEGQIELLDDLRSRGVDTVVVSDVASTRDLGRWSISIPAGVPEWLRPVVSIVPAQLFAYHLTLARGLDPDGPRYLSKVTRTT